VSGYDLLAAALLATSIGALVGGLLGWLFQYFVLESLRQLSRKPTSEDTIRNKTENECNVEYELTSQDVLNFLLYNYEKSPKLGQTRRVLRRVFLIISPVELLIAFVLLVTIGSDYFPFVIALVVFAGLSLIYYFLHPFLWRRIFKKAVKDHVRDQNKLTGKHILSITPDSVTDSTDMGKSTSRWQAIEWIASNDQYLFITVRGSGPVIVPRRAFTDDVSFQQFVNTVTAYQKAAFEVGNPPASELK
jgi:membrane protein YqaA with SNARE-associated domain